ncbi:MAG: hypothetical protein CO108_00600 [Deltaproteobacteria bacterium CG_4_9_14_3_um_filter_63_12]|nr:MAG: hypothetical protein COW42_09670 [Deltaproteobacteria bacterium CG17_big_fil_post_rev_8_21_14_2_50_63_7]PJB49218.1 MAG: hypothetical protein CO108_00600 [Deltaproteobacteria bacterium CG_4_9_14_3_um_filter_63_12]
MVGELARSSSRGVGTGLDLGIARLLLGLPGELGRPGELACAGLKLGLLAGLKLGLLAGLELGRLTGLGLGTFTA